MTTIPVSINGSTDPVRGQLAADGTITVTHYQTGNGEWHPIADQPAPAANESRSLDYAHLDGDLTDDQRLALRELLVSYYAGTATIRVANYATGYMVGTSWRPESAQVGLGRTILGALGNPHDTIIPEAEARRGGRIALNG